VKTNCEANSLNGKTFTIHITWLLVIQSSALLAQGT